MNEKRLEEVQAIFERLVPGSTCRLIDGGSRIECSVQSMMLVSVNFWSHVSDEEVEQQARLLDRRS